nr:uncharacterized protein LOC111420518 [Onthophagus taurus]
MYYIKNLFCVVLLLVTIHAAYSLSCYLCIGPANGGCANGNLKDLVKQKCNGGHLSNLPDLRHVAMGNEIDIPVKASCVQLIATDRKTNLTAYQRGCAFVPQKWKVCKFVEKFVRVKNCTECQSDYCNKKSLMEDEF